MGSKICCTEIRSELNLNVHRTTILRELKSNQFNYSKIPSNFKLTRKVKEKRVELCKEFIINNINWKKVTFFDEKRFSLYGCDSYYS